MYNVYREIMDKDECEKRIEDLRHKVYDAVFVLCELADLITEFGVELGRLEEEGEE